MKLWTIQLAQWRQAKALGIPMLNTTVKSGNPAMAPRWEMVLEYKAGILSEEGYTRLYQELMAESLIENPEVWAEVTAMEEVAIACYCKAGCFCHRRLLVPIFEEICKAREIPFEYMGEITKETKRVQEKSQLDHCGSAGAEPWLGGGTVQ